MRVGFVVLVILLAGGLTPFAHAQNVTLSQQSASAADAAAAAAAASAALIAQNLSAGGSVVSTPAPAGSPDIELLGPVSPIPAKARENLFLAVVNLGPGAIHGVSALVQPSTSNLVVVGQIERSLQDLRSGQSTAIVVRVATPDTSGGSYLTLTFTFTTDAGQQLSLTRSVSIQIAPPISAPLDVTASTDPLVAGRPGNLSIDVANPTGHIVTNLDLTLLPSQMNPSLGAQVPTDTQALTPGGSSALLLHRAAIFPGQILNVQAPVSASLRPEDLVPYAVSATYDVDGFSQTQTFDFGVRVVGDIQLRVLDARLVRTDSGGIELDGTLTNAGTGTAWNPRVTTADGSGLLTDRPQILDDLKPNLATNFFVPVRQVEPIPPGAPLLRIDWNDDFGAVHATDIVAQAAPLPAAQPTLISRVLDFFHTPWGIVALALVALLVGLEVIRRVGRAHREREEAAAEEAEESSEGTDTGDRKRPRGGRKPRPH